MEFEKLNSLVYRIFFFGSFLLVAIAGLERVVNQFGYTFLTGLHYRPGRLLDYVTVLLLFVVALLMRQVRDELKKAKIH